MICLVVVIVVAGFSFVGGFLNLMFVWVWWLGMCGWWFLGLMFVWIWMVGFGVGGGFACWIGVGGGFV